jgi:hypothetical protein
MNASLGSAGHERANLSLLGPVVTEEWKRRNPGRDLPKKSGTRRYPACDAPWINELLRKPWNELSVMVQDLCVQTAAKQSEAQLAANAAVAPRPAAGSVASHASCSASSHAQVGAAPNGGSSGVTISCRYCGDWKSEDMFSKQGIKKRLCLQCSERPRFVCCFCQKDYADVKGLPDGNFALANRETEYGDVCNHCISELYDQRKSDAAKDAAASKKRDDEVATTKAELTKETARAAAAERLAAEHAEQSRSFEETQRVERQQFEDKQRQDRARHEEQQAELRSQNLALERERDGIKKQNADLQEQAARAQAEAEVARERARVAEKRREQAEQEGLCLLCWEEPRGVFFLPCSHVVVCNGCSDGLRKCPICKFDIHERKVFHVVQTVTDDAVSALGAVTGLS